MAGCIGDDEEVDDIDLVDPDTDGADIDQPDDDGLPEGVVDQALVLPTEQNPEDGTLARNIGDYPGLPEEFPERYEYAWDVGAIVEEPSMWGGEIQYPPAQPRASWDDVVWGIFEDLEVGESEWEITLRDDIYWSDGEPITAFDVLAAYVGHRMMAARLYEGELHWPQDEIGGATVGSMDGFEMPDGQDGRTVRGWSEYEGNVRTWLNPGGDMRQIYTRFGGTGNVLPTHVHPYDQIGEEVWEEMQRGMEGEEDLRDSGIIAREYTDVETHERWRDPDHVVTSGLWKLEEIRGTEDWVLTPNEHHRHADDLNFTEVRVPWIEGDDRKFAELRRGYPDYMMVQTPPELADDLPEKYNELVTPLAEGGVIGFNQNYPLFEDVRVRQAFAFALDEQAIAQTAHPVLAQPMPVEVGDMEGREFWLDDEWVDENLIDYTQDLDRAIELMQQAGYERNGDGNWLDEGGPIELTYATFEETPDWELEMIRQLEEFGINVQLERIGEDAFVERLEAGEFDFFNSSMWIGWLATTDFIHGVYEAFSTQTYYAWSWDAYGWFDIPDEEQAREDTVEFSTASGMMARHEFFVNLPPIGDPDGDPEPVNVSEVVIDSMLVYEGTSIDQMIEGLELAAWARNYSLPAIQLFQDGTQHLYNSANFNWPTDHHTWELFGRAVSPDRYLHGMLEADEGNPK